MYFDEYLLNINQESNNNFLTRWKSPSERTLYELKFPDKNSLDDVNNLQAFKAEITLRFAMPINVLTFSILLLSFILSLKFDRVENISRTIKILSLIIILQVLSILSSNISIKFENMQYMNFFLQFSQLFFAYFFFF